MIRMMPHKRNWTQWLLVLVLLPLLAMNVWCAITIHQLSQTRASVKNDYSTVNDIRYSLLSVNVWRDHMKRIISAKIEDFTLTSQQESTLKQEISGALNDLITEADQLIQREGGLRKMAVNTLVDWTEVKQKIPEFTQTIIQEINKPASREKLKNLAEEKVEELAEQTHGVTSDAATLRKLLARYDASGIDDYNRKTAKLIDSLQDKIYLLSFAMIGTLVFFLLLWLVVFIFKQESLRESLFIFSILLAVIVLIVGITTPMLEIDARIKKVDILLLGERLQFHDQVLFFRSKSIVDVVRILLDTKKADSIVVGILLLMFSIVMPITKLLATEIYFVGNQRIKSSRVVNWLAFKSGKWSMADVTVVAIFMAYIGFQGILDDQLQNLNIKSEALTSIATNLTSLQPGFIVFLGFVLYGLALSEILKRVPK